MIKSDLHQNKWSAVVDKMSSGKIVLHTCKIIDHSAKREQTQEFYLGKVKNFLSYNVEPAGGWQYDEYVDLSEWVFPFKDNQVFETENLAKRSVLIQLFSKIAKI